ASAVLHPLSLHAALPICPRIRLGSLLRTKRGRGVPMLFNGSLIIRACTFFTCVACFLCPLLARAQPAETSAECVPLSEQYPDLRSEEHTSELQSRENIVC